MPTELTDGFDLAAQISSEMVRRVFSASFLRLLPGLRQNIAGNELTLWFSTPSLTLLPKPLVFVNPVEITLPFLARASDQFDEATGAVVIRTTISQVEVGSGADTLIAPVVDFRPNAVDSFQVTGLSATGQPIWASRITAAIKPTLERISPFTAGPLFPERSAQYFLSTQPDASFGTGVGVLCVYIWTSGGSPPPVPRSVTPRRISADRAVALVPRDRVEQAIEAGLQANGLRNLPKDVGGVTLTAFSIQWRDFGVGDGHFYLTGEVDHFLGDVSFEAWVKLHVDHGQVKVDVLRTKHDASFFVDLADLFSGGAITRMLEEVLPRAVGGIGGGAFGSLAVFATGAVPEPQAFAAMDVDGKIDIWPSGLGVPADLVATSSPPSFPPPAYLRGHRATREFHTESCEFGALIKSPARFPTWQYAIAMGYNGCWYCQQEHNVVAVGQLFVEVAGVASPMPKVSAQLISEVKRFGVTVRPQVEELQGRFGWNEAKKSRTYSAHPLVPGTWQVIVSHEDWQVTTTVEVAKAWRSEGATHGTATMVHTEVGSPVVTSEAVEPRL